MLRIYVIAIFLIPFVFTSATAEEAWQFTEKAWEAFADEDC